MEKLRKINGMVVIYMALLCVHNGIPGYALCSPSGEVCLGLRFVRDSNTIVGSFANYRHHMTGNIRLLSAENGRMKARIDLEEKEYANTIDTSPSGPLLAAGLIYVPAESKYGQSAVGCYSLHEGRWTWRANWPRLPEEVRLVRFTPDGRTVIAVGYKNIIFYDAASGTELQRINEPLRDYPVVNLSHLGTFLSPSCRYIVVWQEKPPPGHQLLPGLFINKWVTVWDLETRKKVAQWKKPSYRLECATFTRDEGDILFGSKQRIQVWSVKELRMIQEWQLPDFNRILHLEFSGDYRHLAAYSVSEDFHIGVFAYPGARLVGHFRNVGRSLTPASYPLAFDRKMGYFVLEKDGRVCLYDIEAWIESWCSWGK